MALPQICNMRVKLSNLLIEVMDFSIASMKLGFFGCKVITFLHESVSGVIDDLALVFASNIKSICLGCQ